MAAATDDLAKAKLRHEYMVHYKQEYDYYITYYNTEVICCMFQFTKLCEEDLFHVLIQLRAIFGQNSITCAFYPSSAREFAEFGLEKLYLKVDQNRLLCMTHII